ncbi:uroporphyrinogen-III synthase [Sulfurovum sp.]|uniref:uroporphyrinogen-III synthase n=1 Tax=Sulfurovum sp. TaxID=1969726 RepID=UPI002F9520E4
MLYYEYDSHQNRFMADHSYPKEVIRSELIKLTYELSKNKVAFFTDGRSNVIIAPEYTIFSRLKQRIKNIFSDIKNHRKHIYVLSDKEVKHTKSLPMIETEMIEGKVDLGSYDAVVFSSKNGVKYIDRLNPEWKKIPAYAISAQTAKMIKNLGGKVAFVGKEKHGDEFAQELLTHLKGKRTAYIGAQDTVSNFMKILKENGIECDHIPVYRTVCKAHEKKISLPKGSVVIFSSPSTIECFFKNVEWDESFKAISIGRTTAKYFPDFIQPLIAENTSLESCVYKALSL